MNRFEQLRSNFAHLASETYLFRKMEPKTNRLKEVAPKILHDLGSSETILFLVAKVGEHFSGIKPEGKKTFREMAYRMRKGQRVNLSEYIGITKGYELDIEFCDAEIDIDPEKGLVWESNYPAEPGRLNSPYWLTPLESHVAREKTGRELVWALSHGDKNHKPNEFTGAIHEWVENTTGAVMVGDPKNPLKGGFLLFRKLLRGDGLGIYAEGEPSIVLKKADPRSGHLAIQAAERDTNTFAVAVWKGKNDQSKDTIFMRYTVIKPSTIAKLKLFLFNHGYTSDDEINQETANYIMRIIASKMPESKAGYYAYFDEDYLSEKDIEEGNYMTISWHPGKGSGALDPLMWALGKE